MLITSNEYALKSLIAFQQWGKERMNWVFVKHWEQNTGFCYIPDAKFPGGFCDLAGFGLRFLIKSCMLHVLVFWEVLPRSVNRCFFTFQGEPGSFLWQQTELGGDS